MFGPAAATVVDAIAGAAPIVAADVEMAAMTGPAAPVVAAAVAAGAAIAAGLERPHAPAIEAPPMSTAIVPHQSYLPATDRMVNIIGNHEVVLHPDAQIPRMGFLDNMPRDAHLNGVDPMTLAQLLMRERPPQFFHEIHGVNDHFGYNTQYRHQLIQNLVLDDHVTLPGLQRGTRPDGLHVEMAQV